MPLYEYRCRECKETLDRWEMVAEMLVHGNSIDCQCGGIADRVWSPPNLVTDTRFMSGSDDGFGPDRSRRRAMAMRRAKQAGVSIAGARYCPSLAREVGDPRAWVRSKAEARRRCAELGLASEELGVKGRDLPPPDPTPGVADDIVERFAREEIREQKLDLTPKEKRQLKATLRKQLTPH